MALGSLGAPIKILNLPPGALGTWEAISVANPAAVGGPPLRS